MPPPAQGDGVGESGTDAGDAQQRRTASGAAAAASGVPGGESPREASAAPADASQKGKAAAVPLPERLHEALEAANDAVGERLESGAAASAGASAGGGDAAQPGAKAEAAQAKATRAAARHMQQRRAGLGVGQKRQADQPPSRCRRGGASTRRPPPQFRASWPRTSSRQRTSWALAGRRAGRAERLPAGSPPSWQPPRAAGGAGGAEVGGAGPPAADAAGGAGGEEDMSIDGGEGDELLGDVGEDDAAGAGQTQAKRNAAISSPVVSYILFRSSARSARRGRARRTARSARVI